VGTRLTPPPRSIPVESSSADESWDELVFGALGESAAPEPAPKRKDDAKPLERATAVPATPPQAVPELVLDLESARPKSPKAMDPYRLPSDPPDLDNRSALLPGEVNPFTGRAAAPAARIPMPRSKVPEPEASERTRTAPEPVVERLIARVEAGKPSPAESIGKRRAEENLELASTSDRPSPLDLVETYRRRVDTAPSQPAAPDPGAALSDRPSGTVADMQDRYAVGDFTGALVVAESLLDADPENEDAKRYAQSCREVLTQMYAARLGPMDQVATVAVPPDQITWLSLDHRAGFLLSLVDGVSSIEEILDISGMSRLDALRIMYTLVQQNVIQLSH
jgi:hypothetical protein